MVKGIYREQEKKEMTTDYPKRGDIFWIQLDPTIRTEIKKTRPCIILSNNSQNKKSSRIIIAPITSQLKTIHPFEVKIELKEKACKVLLDQIRSLDKLRIGSKIISVDVQTMLQIEEAIKIVLALS